MSRIVDIFRHTGLIFSKPYIPVNKRWRLFWAYLILVFKRFGQRRFLSTTKLKKNVVLGYTVEVENFLDFYYTFVEVFIDNDYLFLTKKKNPYIIDLGGNVGVTAIFFKWLYPDAKIDVYEPVAENADILRKNIKINNFTDVTVVQKAVGGEEGELKIYGDRRVATVCEELIKEQNKATDDYVGKEEVIPIIRLSDELGEKEVDFLKMDIEGPEGAVIQDLDDTGKLKQVRQMSMEYHRYSYKENLLSDIIASLEKNKFDVIFSCDFTNLSKMPKKKYYNFMLMATQRSQKRETI